MEGRTADRILRLHRLYLQGEITGPAKHEVNPGLGLSSRENYLYFTLPCALNFQRSSPALWASALATYNDPSTLYTFFPEECSLVDEPTLAKSLREHRLAIQTNKHPRIWLTLSKTLYEHYDSDPRCILAEGNFDVIQVIRIIQNDKKHLFPFLGGIKLSNYWLMILLEFTDVKLKNTHEISIIPDTHVIQSSARLGVTAPEATPLQVETIWRTILGDLHLNPVEMHAALWRWSRSDFSCEI